MCWFSMTYALERERGWLPTVSAKLLNVRISVSEIRPRNSSSSTMGRCETRNSSMIPRAPAPVSEDLMGVMVSDISCRAIMIHDSGFIIQDAKITIISHPADIPGLQSILHGTPGFMCMGAVLVPALRQKPFHFRETTGNFILFKIDQPKLSYSRGINNKSAIGQFEHLCKCCCMLAFQVNFRDHTCLQFQVRLNGCDECRFPGSRMPRKKTGFSFQETADPVNMISS